MADNIKKDKEKKDSYIEDIISKASKENNKQISPEEVENAIKSTDFLNKMEEIDISNDSYRVIFTDGQTQLLYDDGEFFEISTTDSNLPKKKIGKKEARDRYIEYFIKYVLNPMISKKQRQKGIRTIEKAISSKNIEKSSRKKEKSKEDDLVL